jgi:hypothetical protein
MMMSEDDTNSLEGVYQNGSITIHIITIQILNTVEVTVTYSTAFSIKLKLFKINCYLFTSPIQKSSKCKQWFQRQQSGKQT